MDLGTPPLVPCRLQDRGSPWPRCRPWTLHNQDPGDPLTPKEDNYRCRWAKEALKSPRWPWSSAGTLTPLQEVCDVLLPLEGGLGALCEEAEQQVQQRLHAQTSGLLLLQQQLLQPLQTHLSRHPERWRVRQRPRSQARSQPPTVREEHAAQAPLPGESSRAQPASYSASLAPENIPDS